MGIVSVQPEQKTVFDTLTWSSVRKLCAHTKIHLAVTRILITMITIHLYCHTYTHTIIRDSRAKQN